MDVQLWHLGVAFIVALLGFFANDKRSIWIIKDAVNKAIKPLETDLRKVKNEMIFQSEMITSHGEQLDKYNNNSAFYKSIELTVQESLKYLTADREEASNVLTDIGNRTRDLAKDIINLDIEKIKDEMVKAKCSNCLSQTKTICNDLLGKEFTKGYLKKYSYLTRKYTADTCSISENWVNDKTKRFRSITSVYAENVVTHFINYFKDNSDKIKYLKNSKT